MATGEKSLDTISQSLEAGQFETPSEVGPTPQNTPQAPDNDSGPTPEGRSAADQDKETQGDDSTSTPQPADEGVDPQKQESDDPAGPEKQDSESKDDSDEGGERSDEWFFKGKHSQYRTEDEYAEAIDHKDELVHQYRSQLSDIEEKYQEAKSLLEEQNRILPEDKRKQVLIRAYQLEELGDRKDEILEMSEEDIDSNPEVKDLLKEAEIRAKIRYENEVDKSKQRREEQLKERKERLAEAEKYVRDTVTEQKYGAYTVEDRIRLGKFFQEQSGDLNRAEALMMIYDEYGKEWADWAQKGMIEQFNSGRRKRVQDTVDKAKPDPKPPTPPAPTPKPKTYNSPLDTIRASLDT